MATADSAWGPVLQGSLWVGGQWLAGCSGPQGLSDAGEPGERGGELVSPGPAGGDLDDGPAVAADDPGGGVRSSR